MEKRLKTKVEICKHEYRFVPERARRMLYLLMKKKPKDIGFVDLKVHDRVPKEKLWPD